ncbi:MAG: hypothetical protein EON90_04055 [Brevundimonas sp.]|nr:MAG: hypothetical protein EON90_04055 [Brevundimonas sp.]
MGNGWLVTGGILNAGAAIAHLAVIVIGPRGYEFFGAGPRMVRLAEQGSPKATLITLGIAAVLFVWSALDLSAAGVIPRPPLAAWAVVGIALVFTVRALAYVPALSLTGQTVGAFAWISSTIVLVFAVVHILGALQLWRS